jgi:uncharacterized flavoprotein (TIGR03862 family)
MDSTIVRTRHVAVIGGGPAGLMAAEVIAGAGAGVVVTVFERMPSVGRKLLMAGRGGLNITHSEPFDNFLKNYGAAATWMEPLLEVFPPAALIAWYEGLGQQIFVGSSGRVFPRAMKASPLLRAWLGRLENLGVHLVSHASWTGWNTAGSLTFMDNSRGKVATFDAEAVVLALGGASWPRLGADGGWLDVLTDISIAPMRPANCGFAVDWSPMFRDRYAGTPLKNIALSFCQGPSGDAMSDAIIVRGEAMITSVGIEGGAVYGLSAPLRDAISGDGAAVLHIDLRPDVPTAVLVERLQALRGGASLSTFLRKRAGLAPVAIGLVQEALHAGNHLPVSLADTEFLAVLIKAVPIRLTAPFPLARAISTAGGIVLDEINTHLMLRRRPGVFAAGEMLDWEAPTGGYLLQGCMTTGVAAGNGVLDWLGRERLIIVK